MPFFTILEQGSKWTKTTLNYSTTAGNKELIISIVTEAASHYICFMQSDWELP